MEKHPSSNCSFILGIHFAILYKNNKADVMKGIEYWGLSSVEGSVLIVKKARE